MSNLSRTNLQTLYGTSGSTFPDNTTGEISESDMRAFGQDLTDSHINRTTDVLDEDDMASNSATAVPTQQSVKAYVDAAALGIVTSWKAPVAVATNANITLSGEQTIDGILTSGSRVLVKDQSTGSQNGIYVSAAGAWSRSTDANSGTELEGAAVTVQQGTTYANTTWVQINDGVTIGSSAVSWTQIGTAVSDASETVKGIIEIATQAETNTGSDDARAVTPAKLASSTQWNSKTDQLTTFRRLTGNHTLDSTDLASINAGDDLVIEMNVAGANDLTIPLNATVAFPTGSKITIVQYGAGLTSVVATGGITLNTSSGDALSRGQYAPMVLEKVGTDEWYLYNGTTPGSIVSSGTWTPTLTNTTNVAASTAYACQYLRVGATVTFSGKFSLDATSTGDTVMGMSIPIASAFAQEYHAGGVAASHAVQQSAAIFADATNDRLTIRLTITDTSNRDWFFSGSYQII